MARRRSSMASCRLSRSPTAAAGLGHANISRAGDTGVVRTLPLYALDERDIARPSIALAAVSVAEGATGPLTERPGGVQVGDRFVPLDDAELTINWSATLEQQTTSSRRSTCSTGRSTPTCSATAIVARRRHRADPRRPAPRARPTAPAARRVSSCSPTRSNTILSSGYLDRPSTAAAARSHPRSRRPA